MGVYFGMNVIYEMFCERFSLPTNAHTAEHKSDEHVHLPHDRGAIWVHNTIVYQAFNSSLVPTAEPVPFLGYFNVFVVEPIQPFSARTSGDGDFPGRRGCCVPPQTVSLFL
jgi:hypothetical protein